MADEIRADYDQLGQVSSRFVNQSQVIEAMLADVRARLEPLENGGWIGRGSDAFFNEMRSEILPASTRLHNILNEAGQVTKQIADTVHQAEQEASSLFSKTT